MKEKNCLIFGGTGQIGRNLIRKLAKNNYKVTVITRNIHTKGNFIKTQANAGYIDISDYTPAGETININKKFIPERKKIILSDYVINSGIGKNHTMSKIKELIKKHA